MSTDPDTILLETEDAMTKAVDYLRGELRGIRTGRASTALVEFLKVDYYGSMTDLKAIAAISVPEPTQLLIKPFDAGAVGAENVRHLYFHPGESQAIPDVDVVQRGRFETDDDVGRRRELRRIRIFVAELVDAAVSVKSNGFHNKQRSCQRSAVSKEKKQIFLSFWLRADS